MEETSSDLAKLLSAIVQRTAKNAELRAELNALPPATSSPERDSLSKRLDTGRRWLLALLRRRTAMLQTHIEHLRAIVGPVSDMRVLQFEAELAEHENQLQQLTRWETREKVKSLNAEIAELDGELAALPQVSDPDHPEARLLFFRREELVEERKALAASLIAGAHEYEQFDRRWGAIRYGTSSKCTNIKAAGCGPATLAMLLNYLYAEDPEVIAGGSIEFVTPDVTAKYATTNGRFCNSGTAGDTMVSNVPTQWPGYEGFRITLTQAIDELRGGNLVIFLCKKCVGRTAENKRRSYTGHFMVLSAVDDRGETFTVLDSADVESVDIATITRAELDKHTNGFWIVQRK